MVNSVVQFFICYRRESRKRGFGLILCCRNLISSSVGIIDHELINKVKLSSATNFIENVWLIHIVLQIK